MTIDLSYHSDFNQQMLRIVLKKLRQTQDKQPDNIKTLKRIGEVYRQLGMLQDAKEAYQSILNFDKTHKEAMHWARVLSFNLLTGAHAQLKERNATFYIKHSLLGQDHEKLLLEFVANNIESFKDLGVFMNDSNELMDNNIRQTKGLRGCDDIGRRILLWIKDNYPELCHFFNLPKTEPKFAPTEITIYGNGDFGLAHKDSKHNSLSFLYYFFNQPKSFTGGDLYIYDGDLQNDKSNHTYTKANIESDMFLIFPSHYYHEITPVQCPDNDLLSGRMAFVGHIRK
ncbi:MAG: 2OG-Fe(II) oxygenase [Roseivirga sp.]|jgi:tetratricopeptide (TPR) repeat protein|uniref:2OG-Fe(II) oxygenase n=1 Tax=Roseivirga sp. TaxID=1964215 RepID=UPI001B1589FD|nr:2OG-Fe(II) oxygenase [Roseivirga sp.]MBO6494048.1 2OG-Fe(II) oxygenase [Roseivirga sp.]